MDAVDELVGSLPDGVVVTGRDAVEKYRHDWSREPSAGTPVAVVRAEDAGQVQTAVRWAARHRVPVVPRGAGSGLSGGSSAVDGGIVVSLERMRHVEIDADCQVAVVEPGAFNAEVKVAAAKEGLWYPPDPSSFEICSIGGNVATNAGGLCCVKYGVTTDYVLGLDVVLADGTLVSLGGKRIKDVAGLSLLKLFVGSEGTLGIVTRAILRLVPAQAARSTLVATFPNVVAAAEAVVAVRRVMRPSMMELMDRATINAVEDHRPMGLDRGAGAMSPAWATVGISTPCSCAIASIAASRSGSSGTGTPTSSSSSAPRASTAGNDPCRAATNSSPSSASSVTNTSTAPAAAHATRIVSISSARAAPGASDCAMNGNTHPNIVYDAADPAARVRALAAFDDVMAAAIGLGGTITGEHGVGRTKKAALPDQLGPDVMALTRKIKDALDPDGILNPGAIL